MADPLSVTGVVLTIPALFTTCVRCFELVQAGRTHSKDFELLLTLLDVQRLRLFQWGQTVGVVNLENNPTQPNHGLDEEPTRSHALRILHNLERLFRDTEKLSDRYGLQKNNRPIDEQVVGSSLQSKRVTHTSYQVTYHRYLQDIAQRQSSTSLLKLSGWAIRDGPKFRNMINDIRELIDGLPEIKKDSTLSDDASMDIPKCETGHPGDIRQLGLSTSYGVDTERIDAPVAAKDCQPRSRKFASMADMVDFMVQDCLSSLDNHERSAREHQIESAYGETYKWIFDGQSPYRQWLGTFTSPENPLFWIQGKPGCGKSTLMKYAIENGTREALKDIDTAPWSLIPFFFHDRGSAIQKSVDGLLQEILFRILLICPDLVRHVYKNRLQSDGFRHRLLQLKSSGSRIEFEDEPVVAKFAGELETASPTVTSNWTSSAVQSSLFSIVGQSEIPINLLLFIDALDEHDGSHRRLTDILSRLGESSTGMGRVRLCLASRPEPAFQMAFSNHPSLRLHEHTQRDIEAYVYGHLEDVLESEGQTEYGLELRNLTLQITKKAEGVFIWVKLVVNELVDGIVDGNSLTQLGEILDTIPGELNDLYQRIISNRRKEYHLEIYIMLQVVLSSFDPLDLTVFMSIIDEALSAKPVQVSQIAMTRRLMSRCGGILETKKRVVDERGREQNLKNCHCVQFVHQSAKTFVRQESDSATWLSLSPNLLAASGDVYIMKYLIKLFVEHELGEIREERSIGRLFFYYALKVEHGEATSYNFLDVLSMRSKCLTFRDIEIYPLKIARRLEYWKLNERITLLDVLYSLGYHHRYPDLVGWEDQGVPLWCETVICCIQHGLYRSVLEKFHTGIPDIPTYAKAILVATLLVSVWSANITSSSSTQILNILQIITKNENAVGLEISTVICKALKLISEKKNTQILILDFNERIDITKLCIKQLLNLGASRSLPLGRELQSNFPQEERFLSQLFSVSKGLSRTSHTTTIVLRFYRFLFSNAVRQHLQHWADLKESDSLGFREPLCYALLFGLTAFAVIHLENKTNELGLGQSLDVADMTSSHQEETLHLWRILSSEQGFALPIFQIRKTPALPSKLGRLDIKSRRHTKRYTMWDRLY